MDWKRQYMIPILKTMKKGRQKKFGASLTTAGIVSMESTNPTLF
jgi:hypothetical protein